MAELPEVEVVKQYLDATSLHQKIAGVEVSDERIMKGMDGRKFSALLKGDSLEKTLRHGNLLFVGTGQGLWMAWRLGAAGAGAVRYSGKTRKNREFERMAIQFSNGSRLSYNSTRMAGQIEKVHDPWRYIRENGLGPDALSPELTPERTRELLAGKRARAKAALMNQKVIAGIGNAYSDEILFQAGIHPETDFQALPESGFGQLHDRMKGVLTKAVALRADPARMPAGWLIPHREAGAVCPGGCPDRIERTQVSGKSAYFCPSCQVPPTREDPT